MADLTFIIDPDLGTGFLPIPRALPQPVRAWETDPVTGKRQPSTRQETTPEGVPLWELNALATLAKFGRPDPVVVGLRVASLTQPTPAQFFGGEAA